MKTDQGYMKLYAFRNDLWEVGNSLLENKSVKDKRFGQALVTLGYLIANGYEENDPFDSAERERMRERMQEIVHFAQTVKF